MKPIRPHPETERLAAAIEACLPLVSSWAGIVYRSASPRFANREDLLTGIGSKRTGGRWNPPRSFAAVYTSLDPHTALDEALAQFVHFQLPAHRALPRVLVAVELRLQRVLDLTSGDVRSTLKVSSERMRDEPWREMQQRGREALTQALGRLAYLQDIEALRVDSAARRGGEGLVVFPGNLLPPRSWLRIINRDDLPPIIAGR